ncbi:MAG: ABC transporter substrate-binding protein [Nitrososphaerota archaeon]|nr:ABC transporter substrate-binding protein [Nitrososphaerota archaeon]MDG6938899.1 ABC transporter substrate-binding protein [Nitrososphaerota archaeon]
MKKLVIYTSFSFLLDSFDLALRGRYNDDHFHTITFRDHPQRIFDKIKSETEAGMQTADIVIGPHWLILDLQRGGLLRGHESREFDAYSDGFFDAKAGWGAMALSPVGFTYNTRLVDPKEAPSSLEGVTQPRWLGRLAVHSIIENSEGRMGLIYLTALRRLLGPAKWDELVGRLAGLRPTAYECMPDMALAISKGEKQVGFPTTLSCISYYLEVQNRPIVHRMPEDLPYLATFSPSMAVTAGGENEEIADRAFDYAMSEDWQQRVESFGGKTSPRRDVSDGKSIPEDAEYFPVMQDLQNQEVCMDMLRRKLQTEAPVR